MSKRITINDINNFKSFYYIISLVCILIYFTNYHASATPINKLPLPRFASIKSSKANARKGPNKECDIEWVFIKKGEPVEIINEYEQWREIKDITGLCGWVHISVLSGKRSVIIIGNEPVLLKKYYLSDSTIIAKLIPELRCELQKCNADYCKIKCNNLTGWIEKKFIWGVYKDEEF